MKTEPSGIIDLALGYLSSNYKLYHELPDDKDERLSVIMNVLKKASKMFQAKYEKMPIRHRCASKKRQIFGESRYFKSCLLVVRAQSCQ